MSESDAQQVLVLFRDGQFLKAAEALADHAGAEPDHRNLHNQAAAYYKAGRFERAADLARAALRAEPHSVRTHRLLGLIFRDAGRLEEALRALDRACEIDPGCAGALYDRAVTRFILKRVDEAVTDLRTALELQPENSLGYFNLGVMLVSQARWGEAVDAFVHALKLDPTASDEYASFLVDIGRAQIYEEVYGQGHRLKNMMGVLGDRFRELSANISSRMSPKERTELGEISDKMSATFSDLNYFLSAARHRQLELDLTDMRELAEQVLVACSANLSNVKVRRRFADDLPEVVCDSPGIREALLNLMLNAIEAMVGGGKLTLKLHADAECIEFEVADSGPGIPDNLRETVFRFGFSTKPFGSGLGLSQARRTVERHGGALVLLPNEPTGGTIARMTLPISPRVESSIEDLTIRPVLAEDLRDLLADISEDEELLL